MPRERLPSVRDWRMLVHPQGVIIPGPGILSSSAWQSGPVRVVSSLNQAELPDGSGVGPQWQVSISRNGKRPKPTDIRRALRAFGMVGAELDNHHPGNAQHYWMPLDPAHRVDCECKTDEVTVTDPDGYKWTTPHAEGECRGCEFQRMMGKPCPIHAAALPGAQP